VDNLHQAGGSKNVIEYHGNASTLSCLQCGSRYTAAEKQSEHPPVCGCGDVLKPDVVFFGETIPYEAMTRSFLLASSAEVLMVVGTSAVVSPANTIPLTAKQNGAKLIEINDERTHLTETVIDVFIQGRAGRIMKGLAGAVERLAESNTSI
jgi:NAD-dependent deacetylase